MVWYDQNEHISDCLRRFHCIAIVHQEKNVCSKMLE